MAPTSWNDPEKQSALLEALVTVGSAPSCFDQGQREQIVKMLHDRGFNDVAWNGLRYVILSFNLGAKWSNQSSSAFAYAVAFCSLPGQPLEATSPINTFPHTHSHASTHLQTTPVTLHPYTQSRPHLSQSRPQDLKMPISWNAESDAVLFKAVLAAAPLAQLSTEQRNVIIAFMGQNGFPDVTWEGVRYVIHVYFQTLQDLASFPSSAFATSHPAVHRTTLHPSSTQWHRLELCRTGTRMAWPGAWLLLWQRTLGKRTGLE